MFRRKNLPTGTEILTSLDLNQARIVFDRNGNILEANANFLNTLGYSADQLAGKHHRIFCEPSYAALDAYQTFWDELRSGKAQLGTFKRLTSRGEPVYIQASYCPIKDRHGHVFAVVKYASDISIPTRKTNEALARTQAVISFSLDGHIVEVNDTFLAALGYSRDDIIGRHHRMFCDKEYASSSDYTEFWKKLGRGEPQVGEFERVRKDGRPIYIRAAYNPTFDLSGQVVGVTKFATDITHAREVKKEADSMAVYTAASVEQMKAAIADIARSMTMTQDSVERASEAAQSVRGMINDLLAAGKKMSSVVHLIQAISWQISLLSLNAAIEAARAGDAGRGFAVVADEVKKLASHVSDSTESITDEITSVQKLSSRIATSADQMSDMIGHVKEGASTVAAATEEQSAVVADIAKQVNTLSKLVIEL